MKKLLLIFLFPVISYSQTYVYSKTGIKMTSTRDQKYYVEKTYYQESEVKYIKMKSSLDKKKKVKNGKNKRKN